MLRQSIEKNVQLGLVWSSKDQNKSVSSSVPKEKRALSTPGQWISQHPYTWYIGGNDTGSGGSVDWKEKNAGKINKAWLRHAIVIIQNMLVQIIMHTVDISSLSSSLIIPNPSSDHCGCKVRMISCLWCFNIPQIFLKQVFLFDALNRPLM